MGFTEEILDTQATGKLDKAMIQKFNLVIARDENHKLIALTDKEKIEKKIYLNSLFLRDIPFKEIDKKKVNSMIREYQNQKEKIYYRWKLYRKRIRQVNSRCCIKR